MVDDAWFHPNGMAFNNAKQEFEKQNSGITFNPPFFKENAAGKLFSWENRTCAFTPSDDSTKTSQSDSEQVDLNPSSTKQAKPFRDGEIAELLGKLATERGYGICFCSFEYFWAHYKDDIDRPYHAVFFDINHALRGLNECKELDDRWKTELGKTDLYSDATINNPGMHGWMLHYAMKLGCAPLLRTTIPPSHILLISSNFAEQGGSGTPNGDKNPATQFGTVTLDIWTKLFASSSTPTTFDPDSCMADFGFSPFQKVAEATDDKAEMLTKGFQFFDRTFSKAASWHHFRQALLDDMLLIWRHPLCKMGHDACKAEKGKLRASGWIEAKDRDITLAGTHHLHNDGRDLTITAKSLLAFLKQALLLPDLALPHETEDVTLVYPTSPGAAYLIGIGDLYDTMCVLKPNRMKPSVKIVEQFVNGGRMLCVQFWIPLADVANLESIAKKDDKIKDGKTSGAIQAIKRKSRVLLHYLSNSHPNGIQCHGVLCNENPCKCRTCEDVLTNCCCGDQDLVTFSTAQGQVDECISIAFNIN